MQRKSKHGSFLTLTLLGLFSSHCFSATPVIEIKIHNHLFSPDIIEMPADTKVKFRIHNQDIASEEFESYELNREKVIPGQSTVTIFVGPLRPGEYPFFGEFFPKTAQGKVIVK